MSPEKFKGENKSLYTSRSVGGFSPTPHRAPWFRRREVHARFGLARGFTLIEFIIYIGLAGSLLTVISVLLFYMLRENAKNQVIANVEQEGNQAMQIITQTIRNAQSVNGF